AIWTGTLYMFVPPVPQFEIEVVPYRPDPKTRDKPVPRTTDGAPVVSGREKGRFSVRVANQSRFPASFRLLSQGVEGCQYHLGEQLLRVPAGGQAETVLTADPSGLYWLLFTRLFGFNVNVTPLTGAPDADRVATKSKPGAFRQITAWLHPAPILALLLLLLLPSLLGAPSISGASCSRIVLPTSIQMDS